MLEEFFQICSVKKRNLHMRIFFCSLVVTFRASTAAKNAKDWSLPSFGSHLNPISTRGGRLCPPYTGVLGWLKFAVAALSKDRRSCNGSWCYIAWIQNSQTRPRLNSVFRTQSNSKSSESCSFYDPHGT